MSFTNRTSRPSIVIAGLALLAFTPAAALSQDKNTSRSTLNLLQDAFINIADEVEPTVVTVTARKTVRPKAGALARG